MKESIHELFGRINGIADETERMNALRAQGRNERIFDVLHYGLSPNIEFLVPAGDPPYRVNEDHVNSHPNFWNDVRRLYLFVKGGKDLQDARRQSLFIQMLEFIHPKDAELLLRIKDRNWPYENISAEFVEKTFPGLLGMYVTNSGVRIRG